MRSAFRSYDTDHLNYKDLPFNAGEDISCYFHVVNFMCYKTLTTKCDASKDVEKNEEVHLNYYNDLNVSDLTDNCEGDSEE